MGYEDTLPELQSVFYDHHNYSIKTNYTTRITMLILANFVGTLLTNPIDVCLTKILTQKPFEGTIKYRGLISTLK